MKKFVVFLVAACMAVSYAGAQNSDALGKELKKEYKAKVKELKKDGWKLLGGSRTIEVLLLSHYEKLAAMGADGQEITGYVTKTKFKGAGRQAAFNDALASYLHQEGSMKSKIVSELAAGDIEEFERFFAAYEKYAEKEIKGELVESFSMYKENGDGTFQIQTICTLSKAASIKARERALDAAAKETESAKKYVGKVAEFIRNGYVD